MQQRSARGFRGWRKKVVREMEAALWIIAAVVVVIALVVFYYRQEIGLSFKGWGVQAKLQAKGEVQAAQAPAGSCTVSIGGDATDNRIITGDLIAGQKSTTSSGRNVSIGGSAQGSTIVTGHGKKIG